MRSARIFLLLLLVVLLTASLAGCRRDDGRVDPPLDPTAAAAIDDLSGEIDQALQDLDLGGLDQDLQALGTPAGP